MDIVVRKITTDDLYEAATIAVKGWQTAYRGIIDDEYLDSMDIDETVEKWKAKRYEDGFVVATINDQVVGFARFALEATDDKDHDSELWALYVKPDLKRNGIGRKLVEYVKSYFKENGKNKMVIWCLKENYPSREFYEKMGGKLLDREKDMERGGKIYKEVGFSYDL